MDIDVVVNDQIAIDISNNPILHGKSKHFNIKLFSTKTFKKLVQFFLKHCKTENQVADIFTKALPTRRFEV